MAQKRQNPLREILTEPKKRNIFGYAAVALRRLADRGTAAILRAVVGAQYFARF
jgi:hypothetical protein